MATSTVGMQQVSDDLIQASQPEPRPVQQPQRRSRACEGCNRKKTRCDMQRPSCGLCQRTSSECVFPVKRKQMAHRKIQASAKLQNVNDRIDRLLSMLEDSSTAPRPDMQNRGERNLASSDDGEQTLPVIESQFQSPPAVSSQDVPPLTSINRGVPPFDFLDIDLNRTNSASTTSDLSGGTHIDTADRDGGYTPHSVDDIGTHRATAMRLVNSFFDWVQPWLPLLHQPRYTDWISNKFNNDTDSFRFFASDEALLIWAVALLGSKFITDANMNILQLHAYYVTKPYLYGRVRLPPGAKIG